jgi:hypothetical protein
MDNAFALSIAAVLVSFIALFLTTILAIRQIKLLQSANYIPMIGLISEFRSRELYDDLIYVTTRLRSEHDPAVGISGLPEAARSSVVNIAYYYQSFAWLGELNVLRDEHLRIVAHGMVLSWEAIQPFVQAERAAVAGPILTVLERSYKSLVTSGYREKIVKSPML